MEKKGTKGAAARALGERFLREVRRVRDHRASRWALAVLIVFLGASTLFWARCGLQGCPDPSLLASYTPGGAPSLLDRNGEIFASLHPLERVVVPLDSLPDYVADALVSVEDRRFYRHGGVDWIRVIGAALQNLRSDDETQGASTITMQLARSVFPDRLPQAERTLRRKLLETRVAIEIEHRFSKETILELYANHVYFGGGTYGVEAASRYYFDQPATDLDLAQAALLAGVIQAPARVDPRRNPERALARRNLVLSLMAEEGLVSDSAAAAAHDEPLGVSADAPPLPEATTAPYFVDAVQLELEGLFGMDVFQPGLAVVTTLDRGAQAAAEEELARALSAIESGAYGRYRGVAFDPSTTPSPQGSDYLQGAVVVMETASGDVLALVGGRNFSHSRFNRAIDGRRPVGSAFKPIVVLAALREGFVPSQPILDRPFTLIQAGSPDWSPENYDGEHRGSVSLREALVRSLNVPTARLALAVGVGPIVQAARDLGITDSLPATPALALGTASLSPVELTAAYATLANAGRPREPRFVLRVEDADGRVLFDALQSTGSDGADNEGAGNALAEGASEQVAQVDSGGSDAPPVAGASETEGTGGVEPRLAFLVTDLLRDAVDRGTGTGVRRAGFRGPVAGKTGTTQDGADAWFVGYTPEHVATVWIGHDRPAPIVAGASGGTLAAPVWGAIMASVEETPTGEWPSTVGLVERRVDVATGLVLDSGCSARDLTTASELFLSDRVPAASCPRPPSFLRRLTGAFERLFRGRRPEVDRAPREDESGPVQTFDGTEGAGEILGVDVVRIEGA